MSEVGFLAVAYLLAGAAFGAYLLSLARRQRAAERRIAEAGGHAQSQAPEEIRGAGGGAQE